MPIVFLFLIFVINLANACGKNGCEIPLVGATCYTDSDQECWRCHYGVSLDIDKSCKNNVSNLPLPGDHNVVGLKYNYKSPSSPFDSGNVTYYVKYAYCNESFWGAFSNDDCEDTKKSPEFKLDSNKISPSLSDCINYSKKYVQDINDKYLSNRVCLVQMSADEAKKYIKVGKEKNFICAFNIAYSSGAFFTDPNDAKVLGCQAYPKFNGPPPLFKAVIPYTSFAVPVISDYQGFNSETKFQRPIGSINKTQGSEIISAISIPIDLENNQLSNCIEENNGNENCGSINSGTPDQITIVQNGIDMGTYPRPALEQKANGGLSFFPCYQTYRNPNIGTVYQGVFVFSINSNFNKKIGTNSEGKDIFLNINYMPVLQDKTTPAGCDLCVNAINQNWTDNIYSKLTNPPDKCNLDSDVEIKMVKLVDDNEKEILYPFKDPCNPSSENRSKAPLRVSMYDIDEQKLMSKCTTSNIRYNYISESAFIDKQLVKLKPFVPLLNSNGEAAFITASTMSSSSQDKCKAYFTDSENGSVFIQPGGLRDRSKCFDLKDGNIYTICENKEEDKNMNNSICPGLYQGPLSKDATTPDKICIMTDGIWDFISGRYQVNYIKNLNNDQQIVPRMACTYLPGCVSLGEDTITNIGNAIWDINSDFNQAVKGKCDEVDYNYRVKIETYNINPDIAIDENIRINLQNGLESLKNNIEAERKEGKIIPYITEEYLRQYNSSLYEAYIKYKAGQEELFTCPEKIEPNGTCIGGIYGLDIDLLRNTTEPINDNDRSGCIDKTTYGTPITCFNRN